MSFFNKISSAVNHETSEVFSNAAKNPTFRFGGWKLMGAHTKAPDTRTTEQLLANIDYFAQRNQEVAMFKEELKSMNPKHLGLVSDICELSNCDDLLNSNINLRDPGHVGKNVFATWMEKLPKASKENPEALEFTQEVINQAGSDASKYFLAAYNGILDHPEAAEHIKATKPLVKEIAQAALSGDYTMDYSKERDFINALSGYINPNSDVEKIKLMPELIKVADSIPDNGKIFIDSFPFIQSKVPMQQIKENLEVFPQIAGEILKRGKDVNMTDFLMKNVNLD